jgi:hypothetical protein
MGTSIGAVNDLVAVIRTQLSAAAARPAAAKRAGAKQRAAPGRYAQENLAGLIELRVSQIRKDDPQRGRKAFRVFLEAVLLSHFGEGMVADPKFFQMLDEVQYALEADPACAALIDTAIGHLLSQQN